MIQQNPIPQTSPQAGHESIAEGAVIHAPPTPRTRFVWVTLFMMVGIGVFAALFLTGYVPLAKREAALQVDSDKVAAQMPRVGVVKPHRAPATSDLILPGTVQAFQETSIYARATGTLTKWLVDIGDEVKQGQLLAEIDIPEIDQQMHQSEASLAQTKARLNSAQAQTALAESTLKRYEGVTRPGGISEQDLAEKKAAASAGRSAVKVAEADIMAAEANFKRLSELKSFSRIVAPFAGTVTARNTEAGTEVMAGSSKGEGLFKIAQTDPERVFVHVPQMYAPAVKPGQEALLLIREYPNRKFVGRVARTAKEIDPATRTLLTEIEVPNKDGALLTGMYTQVKLAVARENPPLLVPEPALLVSAAGTQIAVIRGDNKIHFQDVELDVDYGNEIGVASGLTADDWVVANPGQRITEGGQVEITYPQVEEKKADEKK